VAEKTHQCTYCERRFADENALYQHSRSKHRQHPKQGKRKAPEDNDPSMADTLVDAMISHAMGDPVPDYLTEMFPDQFEQVDHDLGR
jgi:hypothetical protein